MSNATCNAFRRAHGHRWKRPPRPVPSRPVPVPMVKEVIHVNVQRGDE